MREDTVGRVLAKDLTDGDHAQLLTLVASYYTDPDAGLEEELSYGDRVYTLRADDGTIGSFLIVDLRHDETTIDGREYLFTYLGLGCARATPFVPLARAAKADTLDVLPVDAVGVVHLSTRTPFAYHAIEIAFGSDVFPTASGAEDHAAAPIAAYIKHEIQRHADRSPDEDPFLLSEVKKVRFIDEELRRIRAFDGTTPLSRYGIDEHEGDELIVLHTFVG
jgi:hypothetical protein